MTFLGASSASLWNLVQTWTGRVFMNPPYGREIGAWLQKAWESAQSTAELVVCLVPARTDTRWWHRYAVLGECKGGSA